MKISDGIKFGIGTSIGTMIVAIVCGVILKVTGIGPKKTETKESENK